jgi:hypothetical protein
VVGCSLLIDDPSSPDHVAGAAHHHRWLDAIGGVRAILVGMVAEQLHEGLMLGKAPSIEGIHSALRDRLIEPAVIAV